MGERKLRSLSVKTYSAFGALLVVAVSISVLATGALLKSQHVSGRSASQVASEVRIAEIYAEASPAVVEIRATSQVDDGRVSYTQGGQGSGFVVDKDGIIVTNKHVVDRATSVEVTFGNGKTVAAGVVIKDPGYDLAVVKVEASAVSLITPLALGDSSSVKPGQTAIALGSPYGLTNSITAGVVSGINRSVAGGKTGMIQTDANIQPGSSGGPLLNSSGQVVGVNTAIEGQGTRIAFALPSNIVAAMISGLNTEKPTCEP